jgi:hypothetical protein
MEPQFAVYVPPYYLAKVVVFNVGPDKWANPYNTELAGIIDKMIDAKGW